MREHAPDRYSRAMATEAQVVDGRALYAKISWRLIPYMFVLYIVAYMDRVNVGFAAMDIQRQLHFSEHGVWDGRGDIFFGVCDLRSAEQPDVARVGTRVWIARIMISWGVVSACMVWMESARSFYLLRFLLGVAEAGFVPGMLLYLTFWFPSHERALAVAKFMTATSLAGVVGAPLSSALLRLDGVRGLSGWQWLFLLRRDTDVLLGISVLFVLKDSPEKVMWMTRRRSQWLSEELERDRSCTGRRSTIGCWMRSGCRRCGCWLGFIS
jgi:ACS family tartrate transporter-like MFS transporter